MLPQNARSLSAAFRHPEAQENLCLVLRGDEECRRGAAEIYSVNLHHPSVREICARHLATLFDDPSKRVREAAGELLRERSGEWTDWQRNLLAAFMQSAGFPDAGAECALGFERTPGPLPPELLLYAERLPLLCGGRRWSAHLMVRTQPRNQ